MNAYVCLGGPFDGKHIACEGDRLRAVVKTSQIASVRSTHAPSAHTIEELISPVVTYRLRMSSKYNDLVWVLEDTA